MKKQMSVIVAGVLLIFVLTTFLASANNKNDSKLSEIQSNNSQINSHQNVFCDYKSFSDKVVLNGRFDFSDSEGPKFAWSGCSIKARFKGTSISIKLKRYESWHINYLNVVIDTGTPQKIKIDNDGVYQLGYGLENKEHVIEITKRDEAFCGTLQFLGFELGDSGVLLEPPKPFSKRIEFIGDSITCGYGNEATDPAKGFDSSDENAYLSYGPIAARNLNAEYTLISWSGIGMYRSYSGDTNEVMPRRYWRILPKQEDSIWKFDSQIPNVVVINLCTNDFSLGIPDRKAFTDAYSNFLFKLREKYPDAFIYCAVGPMLNGDRLKAAKEFINNDIVEARKKYYNDTKIAFFEFSQLDPSFGYGAGYHPNVKSDMKMGEEIASQIRKDLGW